MNKNTVFRVCSFPDGSIVLSCGDDGMQSDLVFASGACDGDPVLEKQKSIIGDIAEALASSGYEVIKE